MMLKNDKWITQMAQNGMIEPFEPSLVRRVENGKGSLRSVISYGLSSYGYDIRLSSRDFRSFRHVPGTVVNPKDFNHRNLEPVPLMSDRYGDYFVIEANSYALGVSLERLVIPDNITVICVGKSTLARCGVIANVTPLECAWQGFATLEFSNSSSADCRIYANEGVLQLLFFEGEPCNTTYSQRGGKYQDQPQAVTLAKA